MFSSLSLDFQARKTIVFALAFACMSTLIYAQTDPGPRAGAAGAGGPLHGLTDREEEFFDTASDVFKEVVDVRGTVTGDPGLGPTFNLDGCAGCHIHPAVGGSSPAINPQFAVMHKQGATNPDGNYVGILSPFGPIREVRRLSLGGGVLGLFTIAGRSDAPGCNLAAPNFSTMFDLRFRIPTPVFGVGLIEAIADSTIAANEAAVKPFGISGHANRSGNDGTITRFGWKAQNKSLVIFSGEAYNVEQGVSNEAFPDERMAVNGCRFNATPEDHTHFDATKRVEVPSDMIQFANFMRFLAPPAAVTNAFTTTLGNTVSAADVYAGALAFHKAGCHICHIPSLPTGNHSITALANKTANLYSDLLVHNIGTGDGITQGAATGDEFRTAPLWGVGHRLFFLHDGSATNLVQAIHSHSGEAQHVKENFNGNGANPAYNLSATERQQLLRFLRSL